MRECSEEESRLIRQAIMSGKAMLYCERAAQAFGE